MEVDGVHGAPEVSVPGCTGVAGGPASACLAAPAVSLLLHLAVGHGATPAHLCTLLSLILCQAWAWDLED